MASFDVQGARQAGYSDTEIADALARQSNFDSNAARQAGYSDQEIIGHLQPQQLGPQRGVDQPAQPTPADQARQQLAKDQGLGETLLVGAGRTFDRIGKGMQQGWYALTGDDKAAADLKARAADDDKEYQVLQKERPVATGVGEALPSMVVPIGGTAGLATTAAKLATSAAVPTALEYGTVEERAKRAAGAAAGAVVGGIVVPKVASTVVDAGKVALKSLVGKITPEAMALAEKAKALGIPVNLAQLSDSKFLKTLSSSLEQLPFTGAAKTAQAQRDAYTTAVSNTFGENASRITPEVYNAAKQRLGQQFEDLSNRNTLKVTNQLQTNVDDILAAAQNTASDDTIKAMKNIAGRLSDQAEGGATTPASRILGADGQPMISAATQNTIPTIPGAAYKSIDTELGNMIKAGGEKGQYAKQMQTAIREGMDASISPEDQAAWQAARDQYRNLKAVRDTVAKDKADGTVPPTALTSALTSTEAGREAMAMGKRGTLGDLAQIGRTFVRDQVPNSGTAQRALTMGLIGGSGWAFGADPSTIAGMMLGGATTGRVLNKMLQDPRVIQAAAREGLSLSDLAKIPPSRLAQMFGGTLGQAYVEDQTTGSK